MDKKVILIGGPPRSGKTTLSRKMAPAAERIHLDQVAILAGIRHPGLLPPEIDAESDIDLTADLSVKIHIFTTHLASIGRLDVLLEEVGRLMEARPNLLVIEGECLSSLRDDLVELLRRSGRSAVCVDMDIAHGASLDGRLVPAEDILREIRRHLDLLPRQYL